MIRTKVIACENPEACASTISNADVKFIVTSRGQFRAELTLVQLPRVHTLQLEEALPRVIHSAVKPERFMIYFLADVNQAPVHHSGMEVSPGDIMAISRASSHYHRSEGPCRWGGMSLTHEDIATAGRSLVGLDLAAPPVTQRLRPPLPLLSRMQKLHSRIERLVRVAPNLLAYPEVLRSIESELIHVMVRCLTDSTVKKMSIAGRRHLAIMRRFEEFLKNSVRSIYLQEICDAIGTPERTLRTCCEEHLGMGPMRYLWLRRMHLARNALLRGNPTTSTVTEIATEFGFWELGRFSQEYFQLFDELPSATLRSPMGDLRPPNWMVFA